MPRNTEEEENFLVQHSLLFGDFKDEKKFQRYFVLFDLLRMTLLSIIVAALPRYPFFQATTNCLITFIYFLFLLYKRPHEKIYLFCTCIIIEMSILVAYSSASALSYYDKK